MYSSYVGIYGFSYLESGKKVIELFRARGWTAIISDNLVGYTLGFVTFLVAIATGLVGAALERIVARTHESDESFVFGPVEGAVYWSFGVSFVVGLWVGSVMMNVVQGAVNALIVCWADSPAKLEYQHPVLTMEMADAVSCTICVCSSYVLQTRLVSDFLFGYCILLGFSGTLSFPRQECDPCRKGSYE